MATTVLDNDAILDIVQMQPPCLLLDRAEVDRSSHSVHAVKGVSVNEPAFEGHFPGHPILPGVMQVEAMRQAGLLAVASFGCGTEEFESPQVEYRMGALGLQEVGMGCCGREVPMVPHSTMPALARRTRSSWNRAVKAPSTTRDSGRKREVTGM